MKLIVKNQAKHVILHLQIKFEQLYLSIQRHYASTGYAPLLNSEKNALEDSETMFVWLNCTSGICKYFIN